MIKKKLHPFVMEDEVFLEITAKALELKNKRKKVGNKKTKK